MGHRFACSKAVRQTHVNGSSYSGASPPDLILQQPLVSPLPCFLGTLTAKGVRCRLLLGGNGIGSSCRSPEPDRFRAWHSHDWVMRRLCDCPAGNSMPNQAIPWSLWSDEDVDDAHCLMLGHSLLNFFRRPKRVSFNAPAHFQGRGKRPRFVDFVIHCCRSQCHLDDLLP